MRLIPFSVHRIHAARSRMLPCIELVIDDFGDEIDLAGGSPFGVKAEWEEVEGMIDQALHFMEQRFHDRFCWTILQDEERDDSDDVVVPIFQ